MKKIFLTLLFSITICQDSQPYPPLELISTPTAGTLPKGTFSLETALMNGGGLLPKFSFGITDKFMLGISYGIQGFIGSDDIEKNKSMPEIQIKYRIYDETEAMPAFVIGLDTQGKGKYFASSSLQRYEQKAMGVYFLASRNWNMLGNLGFHIGVNKNLFEKKDGDEDFNLFFGIDKEINESFSFLMEYNFARNDDGEHTDDCILDCILRDGKGYLNAGLRWIATDNLMLEINVNDILKNNKYKVGIIEEGPISLTDPSQVEYVVELKDFESMNREIKITYFERF
ncbi:MAG: hypothetical protein CMG09_02845 [Candidatus Marinimicrobia bacterium]|nr:hypothetical protein [Candidatus Neomarinimicrobiota bacterium]